MNDFLNIELYSLAILNFIGPISYLFSNFKKNNGLVIDHKSLFSIGFLFYWITPIIIGILIGIINESTNDSSINYWYSFYEVVNKQNICSYLIFSFVFYYSFLIGSLAGYKKIKGLSNRDNCKSIWILDILLLVCIVGLVYFDYQFKDILFTGYEKISDFSDVSMKGAFVSVTLVFLNLAFIYTISKESKFDLQRKKKFFALINNKFVWWYVVAAVFVVSLGGRLYFASSIMMFLTYYTVYYEKGFSLKQCFGVIAFVAVLGILGVWRQPTEGPLFFSALANIFLEPLLTSISLLHFIDINHYEWIAFPFPLLSSFINLLPRAIFPDREDFIINGEDLGYDYYSPLGATNSFYSFMINFGILGSIILIFIFGFFMSRLKSSGTVWGRTVYIMISGFITFTFFRDDFGISIVKCIFQYSILAPTLIVLIIELLSKGKAKLQ